MGIPIKTPSAPGVTRYRNESDSSYFARVAAANAAAKAAAVKQAQAAAAAAAVSKQKLDALIASKYPQGLPSWVAANGLTPVLGYQPNTLLFLKNESDGKTYYTEKGEFIKHYSDKSQGLDPLALLGGVALSFLLPGVGNAIAAELVSAGVMTAGVTADAVGLAIANTAAGVAKGEPLDKALTNAVVGAAVNTGSIEVAKVVNGIISSPAITDAIVSAGASAVKSAAAGGSEEDAAKAALSGLVGSGTTSAVKNVIDTNPDIANIVGSAAGGAVTGGTTGAITSALNTAAGQLGKTTPTTTTDTSPTPVATPTPVASTDPFVNDINQIIEQGTSGIKTAGALPLSSYYSESALNNSEQILRKVVEAANDPNYKVLLPKIQDALSRVGVTVSELASRLSPAALAATLMTYSPNAGDPNEIATVAEKFKTFTGYDPTETLKTEAPKITQPKRPVTPTPVSSSDVVTPIPSGSTSVTDLPPLSPEDAPLLDLIAQQPIVPQPVTEVTAETPSASVTSSDKAILDLITPTTTDITKTPTYTPNISIASPVVTPTVAPTPTPTLLPPVVEQPIAPSPVPAPEIAPTVAPLVTPTTEPIVSPTTAPTVAPEVLPSPEIAAKPALEPAAKDVIETPVSPVVSPVLVTPEPTSKPSVPLTDDEKILKLITPELQPTPISEPTVTPEPTSEPTSTSVPTDASKDEVPVDKEKLYKPKITTKTVVTPKKPPIPTSVLSQALSTTGLTASRGAGEIEDPSTGKKKRKVWNEETLRLKDALGV